MPQYFLLHIFLLRTCDIFTSNGIDKFWLVGITVKAQKFIQEKSVIFIKILKLHQLFIHNFLCQTVWLLPLPILFTYYQNYLINQILCHYLTLAHLFLT